MHTRVHTYMCRDINTYKCNHAQVSRHLTGTLWSPALSAPIIAHAHTQAHTCSKIHTHTHTHTSMYRPHKSTVMRRLAAAWHNQHPSVTVIHQHQKAHMLMLTNENAHDFPSVTQNQKHFLVTLRSTSTRMYMLTHKNVRTPWSHKNKELRSCAGQPPPDTPPSGHRHPQTRESLCSHKSMQEHTIRILTKHRSATTWHTTLWLPSSTNTRKLVLTHKHARAYNKNNDQAQISRHLTHHPLVTVIHQHEKAYALTQNAKTHPGHTRSNNYDYVQVSQLLTHHPLVTVIHKHEKACAHTQTCKNTPWSHTIK